MPPSSRPSRTPQPLVQFAVCTFVALTLYSYVHVIECGSLENEQPHVLRRTLSDTLSDLADRSPSVVILENLDQVHHVTIVMFC